MAQILIIEDDTTLQKVYAEVLKQEGFVTAVAGTGKEAFKLLKESHPSLILLDIMLPGGINGFDILSQVKLNAELANIPVIVLSNLDSERQAALDYGASDYFFKATMDLHTLIEKIKHLTT